MRGRTAIVLMLTLVIAALGCVNAQKVTIDPNVPNAPGTAKPGIANDPRLNVTINYHVKLRPVADIVKDLSEMTGVELCAGHNSYDWRVREDCATIMADDISMSALMTSLAHVMKFRWNCSGSAPNFTYRLVEDPSAIAEIKQLETARKKQQVEQRKEYWNDLVKASKMSQKQLAELREQNPGIYLYVKSGVANPLVEFMRQSPDVMNAWLSGNELRLSVSYLTPSTREALLKAVQASLQAQARVWPNPEFQACFQQQLSDLHSAADKLIISLDRSRSWAAITNLMVSANRTGACFFSERRHTESGRLSDMVELRAYEEGRPLDDVFQEMKSQISEASKKEKPQEEYSNYTEEPQPGIPDDPAFSTPLKKKIEVKTITGLVESLTEASGFAIVTDDYRGKINSAFDEGTELGKVLTSAQRYRQNWNRSGSIIEIWNADWYEARESRVSKVWLERLIERYRTNGTLDIDDLADIALLRDEQLNGKMMGNDYLRSAMSMVCSKRDYLRIYASLNPTQRELLFSESGLSFADLLPAQQQLALKLMAGKYLPAIAGLDPSRIGLRIYCAKEMDQKRFSYTFTAACNFGPIPGDYSLRTPIYVEPPKKK